MSRSTVDFSGLWGIWDGPSHSGNVYCGQMNQYFRYFLGGMDAVCSGPKKKRIIQTVTSNKSKSQGLSWYGVVSVPLAKVTCTSVMAPLMLKSTEIWSTICCLQEDIFSRDVHAYFNKTMQNHILHTLQSPGCGGRGYGYLTGLPAVPTCLQRECVAHFEAQNATTKTPYCCPP